MNKLKRSIASGECTRGQFPIEDPDLLWDVKDRLFSVFSDKATKEVLPRDHTDYAPHTGKASAAIQKVAPYIHLARKHIQSIL